MQQTNGGNLSHGGTLVSGYQCNGFYDEMFFPGGSPRPGVEFLADRLASLPLGELQKRQRAADHELLNMGITFNVYGHAAGTEKIWPFDLVPRVIHEAEWRMIESGLKQRIRALNMFIDDMYHDQRIIREGVMPEYMIASSKGYLKQLHGM
ncbi:MAG: circularly permuted type 2 ATP-grasp protein, partial [Planctomycetes bacterium]|nr:circularly permuted type 2 ATP-grasp protein [Planctomycetota bacterium]